MRWRDRGQSEVVGVILLTAVIVVLVSLVGAVILAQWQSEAEGEPRAHLVSSVDETTVTIEHHGGDSFDPAELLLIVEERSSERLAFDEFTDQPGDRVAPGTTWDHAAFSQEPFEGVVVIFVIHEPTNTIIHEDTHKRD